MLCGLLPLKFTVFEAALTFSVPAVRVSAPAMPKVAFADNCNDVPLIITLKRLGDPLSVLLPVKVAAPPDAVKPPLTTKPDAIVKLTAVVTVPLTESTLKVLVPAPDMVFEVPLMVMVPPLAIKLPLTDRLPVTVIDEVDVTDPVMVKLSSEIATPAMVVFAPVIDNVPPDACVKDPAPVVARFPVKLSPSAEKLTCDAATVRLLKF